MQGPTKVNNIILKFIGVHANHVALRKLKNLAEYYISWEFRRANIVICLI